MGENRLTGLELLDLLWVMNSPLRLAIATSVLALVAGCRSDKAAASGQPDYVWKFDGKTNYVQVESEAMPALGSGDFAVEMWFKPDTLGVRWDLFDWKDTGDFTGPRYNDLALYFDGGSLRGYSAIGPDGKAWAMQELTGAHAWHHAAVVRSGASLLLLLDNTVSRSAVPGSVSPTGPLRIGANRQNGTGSKGPVQFPFAGLISDVRIYTSALDFATFAQNVRLGSVPPDLPLVRRWKLNEDTASVALEFVHEMNGSANGASMVTTSSP